MSRVDELKRDLPPKAPAAAFLPHAKSDLPPQFQLQSSDVNTTFLDTKEIEHNRRAVLECIEDANNFEKRKAFFKLLHRIRNNSNHLLYQISFYNQENPDNLIEISADELLEINTFFLFLFLGTDTLHISEGNLEAIFNRREDNHSTEKAGVKDYVFLTEKIVWCEFSKTGVIDIKIMFEFYWPIVDKLKNDPKIAIYFKEILDNQAYSKSQNDIQFQLKFLKLFHSFIYIREDSIENLLNEKIATLVNDSKDEKCIVLFETFKKKPISNNVIDQYDFLRVLHDLLKKRDHFLLEKKPEEFERDLQLAKVYLTDNGYEFYQIINELDLLKEVVLFPETVKLINALLQELENDPVEGLRLLPQLKRILKVSSENEILVLIAQVSNSHAIRCSARNAVKNEKRVDVKADHKGDLKDQVSVMPIGDAAAKDSGVKLIIEKASNNKAAAEQLLQEIEKAKIPGNFTLQDKLTLNALINQARFALDNVDNSEELKPIFEALHDTKAALNEGNPKLLLSCYQATRYAYGIVYNHTHNQLAEHKNDAVKTVLANLPRPNKQGTELWKPYANTLVMVNKAVAESNADNLKALKKQAEKTNGSTWSTLNGGLKIAVAFVCVFVIPVVGWVILNKIMKKTTLSKNLSNLHDSLVTEQAKQEQRQATPKRPAPNTPHLDIAAAQQAAVAANPQTQHTVPQVVQPAAVAAASTQTQTDTNSATKVRKLQTTLPDLGGAMSHMVYAESQVYAQATPNLQPTIGNEEGGRVAPH